VLRKFSARKIFNWKYGTLKAYWIRKICCTLFGIFGTEE